MGSVTPGSSPSGKECHDESESDVVVDEALGTQDGYVDTARCAGDAGNAVEGSPVVGGVSSAVVHFVEEDTASRDIPLVAPR